jgi:fatty-acyl-CoA synthase
VGDYLGQRAATSPDALAIVDTGRELPLRLSFEALDARARALAGWLAARGVGAGDRVAILALDGSAHLESFGACGKLGAIHVPLNWRLHSRELDGLLARARPRVLLYSREFTEVVEELRPSISEYVEALLVVEAGEGESLSNVVERRTNERPVCDGLTPEGTAALIFTGGTTGVPKGAMCSHRMIAFNALDTAIHDLRPGDVYLNVFPLFHTGGLFVYTVPQLILGGATVLMPRFDPDRVLELIERERVTVFAAVPTMYQRLTESANWNQADLGSLRFCSSGGAPLPVHLIEQFAEQKQVRFKQGFGMSEFGPGAFSLPPEDAVTKAGSVGKPEFFVEAEICDDQGTRLGADQTGELWLRGPVACSGYFEAGGEPTPVLDDDGWFHTGDLARVDADGYFFIVGRKKDMYISGGENVYPVEIEDALYQHPAVAQCAVVGVPDPRWGQSGVACVVLEDGHDASGTELIAFLRQSLAGFKLPRRVEFMDELPLSGPGKILKRKLRERLGAN